MAGPWETLGQVLLSVLILLGDLVWFLLQWSLVIAWLAWALWGVNWRKTWPVLARGGWAPLVLLVVFIALAWSQILPEAWYGVPNFWWQLGAVSLLAAATLFCGWLQDVLGWTPAEVELEPPAVPDAHEHGHH
ncbi:MAG TPA: hypothetical protein VG013_02530 [Gemmataceae bacterium]|jgi:hypothetical protein|nr:hypothetical protein [Gemmataceae bacterium]